MKIEMALTARRTALTLAVAGALLGFAAPAASAGPKAPAAPAAATSAPVTHVQDGPSYIIDGPGVRNGNGPHAFIVNGDGTREPVFFCDADKPNKRHNICIDPIVPGGDRF
jgi:hypothetical protein